MRKKIILAMIIAGISIMLGGCTSFGTKDKAPITDVNVYTGTDGLDMEFLKDSPPSEMYENEEFQAVVDLKNMGAYPINNGRIVITDEPDYMDIGTSTYSFNLKGKEAYVRVDDETVKDFFLKAKTLEDKSVSHQSTILATACYDYGTKLNTEICIDTDPHNLKMIEKACQAKDLSFSGQGAPVSIERIEQKMLVKEGGDVKPQFLIYIKNNGDGQVLSKNMIDTACGSSSMNRQDINGLTLKAISFSHFTKDDMNCTPSTLRLTGGEDYFVCTLKDEMAISGNDATFTSNLYVELEYGYTVTKAKEFIINKLNT